MPLKLAQFVERVRAHTEKPLAVGFGISTLEQAATVGQIADGVIIGSALIKAAGAANDPAAAARTCQVDFLQGSCRGCGKLFIQECVHILGTSHDILFQVEWLFLRILALKTLRDFWEQPGYADSKRPLVHWYAIARRADWSNPHDIKSMFGNASFLADNRVVFNISGNKHRLVVKFNFRRKIAYIRFIGTHAQYDKIEAEKV